MSVEALVARIRTRPIDGADNIQAGITAGYQVVVGKDVQDNQLGIFFPTDGAMSHEMAYHNNLYRVGKGSNKNPEKSGYLEDSRRVRNIKLRGVASEGIWIELSSVAWTGIDPASLKEGDTFTKLNGHPVFDKYYTPSTNKAREHQQQERRNISPMFYEHFDTNQLRHYVGSIPTGASLVITEKVHGTSGRTGNLLVEMPLTTYEQWYNKVVHFFRRFAKSLSYKIPTRYKWQHISGTRRTICRTESFAKADGYHAGNFRQAIHDTLSLHKGETIYYEIVGWEGLGGSPIMHPHTLIGSDPVRKALAKNYPGLMYYSYGCNPGEYRIYVYRITNTNVDGKVTELSWDQVLARCNKLGLIPVPEIVRIHEYDGDQNALVELCKTYAVGSSILDNRHIREGVCVRVEHPNQYGTVTKLKSFEFSYLEGVLKDASNYVDPEESV